MPLRIANAEYLFGRAAGIDIGKRIQANNVISRIGRSPGKWPGRNRSNNDGFNRLVLYLDEIILIRSGFYLTRPRANSNADMKSR